MSKEIAEKIFEAYFHTDSGHVQMYEMSLPQSGGQSYKQTVKSSASNHNELKRKEAERERRTRSLASKADSASSKKQNLIAKTREGPDT